MASMNGATTAWNSAGTAARRDAPRSSPTFSRESSAPPLPGELLDERLRDAVGAQASGQFLGQRGAEDGAR